MQYGLSLEKHRSGQKVIDSSDPNKAVSQAAHAVVLISQTMSEEQTQPCPRDLVKPGSSIACSFHSTIGKKRHHSLLPFGNETLRLR